MVMRKNIAYFINNCDADTSKYISCLQTKLASRDMDTESDKTKSFLVLDCDGSSNGEGTINLAQYYMSLCRKYALLPNERTTLLSCIDQVIAIQLCLAEKNKQETGEFEVETSTVLQANKDIVKYKLSLVKSAMEQNDLPSVETDSPDLFPVGEDVLPEYEAFLKHCNYTDMCDILLAVSKAQRDNETLRKEMIDQSLIFIGLPRNEIEKTMVEYLCEGCTVENITLEVPLDLEEGAEAKEEDVRVIYSDTCLEEILGSCAGDKSFFRATPGSRPTISLTESYIELVFGSYLELLVNSRAELALARSLNTPERELTHQAFTDLKREAKTKKMTMYQTAVSYVMKIRLGGKGYAPGPNSPLAQHVKGFGEFVSLVQKLQTVIEEEADKRVSCRRVLNIIKKEIVRCRENHLRISSVESVCEKLQAEVVRVISMFESSVSKSPDKHARDGGSAAGRHTLKVLRYIVDKLVSGMDGFKLQTLDFLCDGFSSQRTPVRFPCIMSQFRSPEDDSESPDGPYNKSLSDRLLSQQQADETPIHKKRYKSCMAWADPAHQVDVKSSDDGIVLTQSNVIIAPSKTMVHPGKNTNMEMNIANRVAETINDQENIQTAIEVTQVSDEGQGQTRSKVNKANKEAKKNPRKGQKRASTSADSPAKPSKKPKPQSKTCRRKLLPQVKGQQQLTKFFRV